jgi:hypothetical protein
MERIRGREGRGKKATRSHSKKLEMMMVVVG